MATPLSLVPIVTSSLTSQHTPTPTKVAQVKEVAQTNTHSPQHHQSTAEVSPIETLVGRTLLSAKKTGLLSKVTSFTPPYIAISRCPSHKYRVKEEHKEGGMGRKKAKKEGRGRALTIPPQAAQSHKRTALTLNELENLTQLHSNKLHATRKVAASSPPGGKTRKKPTLKTAKSLHKGKKEVKL